MKDCQKEGFRLAELAPVFPMRTRHPNNTPPISRVVSLNASC